MVAAKRRGYVQSTSLSEYVLHSNGGISVDLPNPQDAVTIVTFIDRMVPRSCYFSAEVSDAIGVGIHSVSVSSKLSPTSY